jgi:hypothetical protein
VPRSDFGTSQLRRAANQDFCLQGHNAVLSVDFQQTERRHIPEDRTLHTHRCENLKCTTARHDRRYFAALCPQQRTELNLQRDAESQFPSCTFKQRVSVNPYSLTVPHQLQRAGRFEIHLHSLKYVKSHINYAVKTKMSVHLTLESGG